MHQTIVLSAGVAVRFAERGDFFRVMSATVADLTVRYYMNGSLLVEAGPVGAGYAERIAEGGFDAFEVVSAGGQSVQIVSRMGNDVRYDTPPTGAVTVGGEVRVAGSAVAFSQSAVTVTTTSANLLGAQPNRRYVHIQNKSATGTIYVNLQGSAATAANGFRLRPGEALELSGVVPSNIISAIGDIASNPDVVVAYNG